jgi:urease accessory protein
MVDKTFLKLLQVCDSTFPIGAFTLSNGLETYVQKGLVASGKDLRDYLRAWLSAQQRCDLAAAALAYEAAASPREILLLDERTAAYKLPMEVREGSRKMCIRFLKLMKKIGISAAESYQKQIEAGRAVGQYPVAFGLYARMQGIAKEDAILVYAYNMCSAIVTGCVKLIPMSQTDGQRVLYETLPAIEVAAKAALHVKPEALGLSLPGLDIRAMQHERLYTRQYLS